MHETGAVEATGHKVLALPSEDGKITAWQIQDVCEEHLHDDSFEHVVQPGMVYISNPTENGTLYNRKELSAISDACRKYGLTLFLDGARLGYGLMAAGNDITLQDLAQLCDVFYIGGTKVGALFGEAVVITKDSLKKNFRYFIKQRGRMLAQGRLLGIQFEDKNIPFAYESVTNQQFPILTYEMAMTLAKKYSFSMNETELKKGSAKVRFCTSWATKEENVDELIADIMKL